VVHYFSPAKNLELIRRIRGALAPRARLLPLAGPTSCLIAEAI